MPRRLSRIVQIGDTPLGGHHPIRIQSMTTTDTMDTLATVEQSIRMIEAGCEYVRITAPSINEARNLENIKIELRKRGYTTPLVADIHFTPNAAEFAARVVEKVRINPGNYFDKKKFEQIEYTDAEYADEIDRISKRFLPLVGICKEYGTAMRIGTNHGSLSDRIMSRYGDTPMGMVESALEFLRICRSENYHQIVLSMKSSNPQVMVQAYRLLVQRMDEEGMDYPLHIGVTEAGEGMDGRIKSAVGIGTLLADGLGDTVRVSLTEDPEFELPVARGLVDNYVPISIGIGIRSGKALEEVNYKLDAGNLDSSIVSLPSSILSYSRRQTQETTNIGSSNVPRVVADLSHLPEITEFDLKQVGHIYDPMLDKWHMTDQGCDFIFCGKNLPAFMLPNGLKAIVDAEVWVSLDTKENCFPLWDENKYQAQSNHPKLNFVSTNSLTPLNAFPKKDSTVVFVLGLSPEETLKQRRKFFQLVDETGLHNSVIIKTRYPELDSTNDKLVLQSSTDLGSLLIDGMGDGVWIAAPKASLSLVNQFAFGTLQACRLRISKTEYISCPSCGRTLFDLQETTALIRKRTEHLKGVKIGIMGCIVNGPGEMADADYGYVGSGPGKITLYKGKEVMKRSVPSGNAVDELISLIAADGNWVEPQLA